MSNVKVNKTPELKKVVLLKTSKFPDMELEVIVATQKTKGKPHRVSYQLRIPDGPNIWITIQDGGKTVEDEAESMVAAVLGTVKWSKVKGYHNKENTPLEFNRADRRFIVVKPVEEEVDEPEVDLKPKDLPTEG